MSWEALDNGIAWLKGLLTVYDRIAKLEQQIKEKNRVIASLELLMDTVEEANDNLSDENVELQGKIESITADMKMAEKQILELSAELASAQKELEKKIPDDILKKSDEIISKYPEANVVYGGYVIKLKDTTKTPQVYVTDFIQVMRSHIKWCEDRGLTLPEYLDKYVDWGDAINNLMYDITKYYVSRKYYKLDSELYGVDENWAPAIDTWYLKEMDCENSTIELMALFEAAGLVGPLKAFYWNVCGNCKLGGHSTLNAYDFRDDCWRHIETTVRKVSASDFHGFPDNHDEDDQLNITSVWWSFNSDMSRHTFSTAADKKAFEDRDKFKDFIIKKKRK